MLIDLGGPDAAIERVVGPVSAAMERSGGKPPAAGFMSAAAAKLASEDIAIVDRKDSSKGMQ